MSSGIDWQNYARVHSDRRNLVIHALAVPLFVAASITLVGCLVSGNYPIAFAALFVALTSMLLQGRGHALEVHAPEPFSGPGNFLKRWFREQFFIFPVFLLSGRWQRQFRMSATIADER